MYILAQNEMTIVNSDTFGLFSVGRDNDVYDKKGGFIIFARAAPEAKPIKLAKYPDKAEANLVLKELYHALREDDEPFEMPEPEDEDE